MLVILCCVSLNIITSAQTLPGEEVCEPLSTFSKFICEMNERNPNLEQFFYGLNYSEPISGIAYHPNSTYVRF